MPPFAFLARHRLRWINGAGFAVTLFLGLWLVMFGLSLALGGRIEGAWPMPMPFLLVGAVALLATLVLLGVVLFRYAWHGHDLSHESPRLALFAWTCAGEAFCLSQVIARFKFGAGAFPGVPVWVSDLYWMLVLLGVVVFTALFWVNAEGAHRGGAFADDAEDLADDPYGEEDAADEAGDAHAG